MGKVVVVLLSNDAAGQMWDAMQTDAWGFSTREGGDLQTTVPTDAVLSSVLLFIIHYIQLKPL